MPSSTEKPKFRSKADLQAALLAAEADLVKSSSAHEALTAARKNVLLSGDDAAAEKHDAEIARQARAKDRASLLIEDLKAQLAEADGAERRAEIARSRAEVEAGIAGAERALKEEYQIAAERLLAIVAQISKSNTAADNHERRYPDEPKFLRAETRVRAVAPQPKRVLSEETVELWVFTEGRLNGQIVGEQLLDKIRGGKLYPGSGTSGANPPSLVEKRLFLKRTFLPATRGALPPALAYSLKLPGLVAGDRPIWEIEAFDSIPAALAARDNLTSHRLTVAPESEEQVEFVPASPAAAVAEASTTAA